MIERQIPESFINLVSIIKREEVGEDLNIGSVVSFALNDDRTRLVVLEECDQWFSVSLTPSEVRKLIRWLLASLQKMQERA